MIALVDYDNIPRIERNRGLAQLAHRIANVIGPAPFAAEPSLRLRLYGGWFNKSNASRNAQALVAELGATFPIQMVVSDATSSIKLPCRAEMAYSLACDPGVTVTHTYRPRSLPPALTCSAPPFTGCANPGACPVVPLHDFFHSGQCSVVSCAVSPEVILTKPEQKLVDSMIIADLIHLTRASTEQLAVVSTDDDILPGIRLALLQGARLIHVHPAPGRAVASHYQRLVQGAYTSFSF